MKLPKIISNLLTKSDWKPTLQDLEARAAGVTEERQGITARMREIALPSETGDTAAAAEMKTLIAKDDALARRQTILADAIAAARVKLDDQRGEEKRQAESAHRAEIAATEARLYSLIDDADAKMAAAGQAVELLRAESLRLYPVLGAANPLYKALSRGTLHLSSALAYHGFRRVLTHPVPLTNSHIRPLSSLKSLSGLGAIPEFEPLPVQADEPQAV